MCVTIDTEGAAARSPLDFPPSSAVDFELKLLEKKVTKVEVFGKFRAAQHATTSGNK